MARRMINENQEEPAQNSIAVNFIATTNISSYLVRKNKLIINLTDGSAGRTTRAPISALHFIVGKVQGLWSAILSKIIRVLYSIKV